MSLSFLSKKTWHTTNLTNVEKVWAAEEKQKVEERKLEEWKKTREEERQIMELHQLQQEMGKKCVHCSHFQLKTPLAPVVYRQCCAQ